MLINNHNHLYTFPCTDVYGLTIKFNIEIETYLVASYLIENDIMYITDTFADSFRFVLKCGGDYRKWW